MISKNLSSSAAIGDIYKNNRMKQMRAPAILCLVMFLVMGLYACLQIQAQAPSSVLGSFAASTPCNNKTPSIPGVPAGIPCELMKWKLILYHNPGTKAPATYTLYCQYGMSRPGSLDIAEGGGKLFRTGKWIIQQQAKGEIYRLDPDKPEESIFFRKISDDLLHLLDNEHRLMIGNAAWSYTFNKMTTQ
jgi:hypothetical protein